MALRLWLGFPKSLDISKAIDKKLGAEREVVGTKKGKGGENLNILSREGKNDSKDAKGCGAFGQGAKQVDIDIPVTIPASDEAREWDGWGTALKPANEPIVLARKPISEKTIAENVLKWGTGGLNIDGCRVGWKDERDRKNGWRASPSNDDENEYSSFKSGSFGKQNEQGRFPANVILDEEAAAMLDQQSGITRSGKVKSDKGTYAGISTTGFLRGITTMQNQHGDSGGASRFFYCAKASRKERGEFNKHPTVKPIALMEYLIKLVTPPEGIVLDPFLGSGTTALAALNLGRFFIGIELNEEYCEIARRRIEQHKTQTELFA